MQSLVEYLAFHAKNTPLVKAVIANGKELTYSKLWDAVRSFADYLNKNGIKKGDRVIVKGAHTVEYAVCCYAIHLCGAVFVPVESNLKPLGVAEIAERMSASFIISNEDPECGIKFLDQKEVEKIYTEKTSAEFDFPTADMNGDILFTTGTTGKSKGVLLSHLNLVAIAKTRTEGTEMKKDNVFLVTVPMNHSGGISKLHMSVYNGSTIVMLNGFMNLKWFFKAIEDYKVSSLYLPPSAVRMLIQLGGEELKKYKDQIDFVYSSSAKYPESDKEKLCQVLPNSRLYNGFGGSEFGSACMLDYNKHPGMINCVGKPNNGVELIITDENRKPKKSDADNTGLIAIKSDMNMMGYWDAPELTAETMENGFIYTSDLGYIDENGYVFMVGRAGDVINVGGLKVAPTEVEEVALRCDGVKDCACLGVDDKRSGKVVKLLVVEKDGETVDTKEIKKTLSKSLEAYKIPKIIEITDSIPRTFNGKIDRKKLH